MTENPWQNLGVSVDAKTYSARRADPYHPFDFFWGKDFKGRNLLLMVFDRQSRATNQRLPLLKGIEVTEQVLDQGEKNQLVLLLKEQSNTDLFYRLCCDLLDGTRSCNDERNAVITTLSRLWRWHRLMRQGNTDKLSISEQKGLIGELSFLKDTLFTNFKLSEAISFWQGPVSGEGEKDFSIGFTGVEIKTRSASAHEQIRISSEGQLEIGAYKNLLLVVFEISAASSQINDDLDLHRLISQIRKIINVKEPQALDRFEEKLVYAGYSDLHNYEDDRFILLGMRAFKVRDSFPRIVEKDIPEGVNEVSYSLDLTACNGYEIDESDVLKTIFDDDNAGAHKSLDK